MLKRLDVGDYSELLQIRKLFKLLKLFKLCRSETVVTQARQFIRIYSSCPTHPEVTLFVRLKMKAQQKE